MVRSVAEWRLAGASHCAAAAATLCLARTITRPCPASDQCWCGEGTLSTEIEAYLAGITEDTTWPLAHISPPHTAGRQPCGEGPKTGPFSSTSNCTKRFASQVPSVPPQHWHRGLRQAGCTGGLITNVVFIHPCQLADPTQKWVVMAPHRLVFLSCELHSSYDHFTRAMAKLTGRKGVVERA